MEGSVRVGRVAGIEVGVHYTWLFALFLITFSLAAGFFPNLFPGWSPLTYWVVGLAGSVLLFVSVLIHEFAHSLVAQARGLPVRNITLFIFGGISNIGGEARSARDEFLIAIAGPISSLVLSGIFWGSLQLVLPGRGPLEGVLFYLAFINLALAIFNMVPGFPLDGGRVLRSILWGITGSLKKATDWAAGVGQVVAFGLILWGLVQIFQGNLLGGLWTAFIGWFLNSAAEASRQQVGVEETLAGVPVEEVMLPAPATVDRDLSLADLIAEYALRRGQRALAVVEDGSLLGIVTLVDVARVPTERWGQTRVAEVMTRPPLATAQPREAASTALRLMNERGVNQLPVMEDTRVVGMITRAAIMRYLQLRQEMGLRRRQPLELEEEEDWPRAA